MCINTQCAYSQPGSLASPRLSGPLPRPQRGFWGYSCRTIHSGPTLATPGLFSPSGPGRRKVLGWADSGGDSVEFSFGYILKAKVSWTLTVRTDRGEEEEGPWLGLERETGPPQPLHPKEHKSTWGGSPSVSCFPPPTAPNKRRSPLPQGQLPTPTWAVHSVVFSSPMAQGATGGGGSPSVSESQLDSGSDPGLLVHPGTHSLCHLFF